jgi:hypothetical protein
MKDYLENLPTDEYNYIRTWTTNPENWKAASPIFHRQKHAAFLIYVGEQTYGSIKTANNQF